MTISNFSLLRLTEQLALLHADGVYLSKRRSGRMTVLLYDFHNVYVEIFYTKYRSVVHHIEYSASVDVLEPYLAFISIENFLSQDG